MKGSDNRQYHTSAWRLSSLHFILTTLLARSDSTQLHAWLTRDSYPIIRLCAIHRRLTVVCPWIHHAPDFGAVVILSF